MSFEINREAMKQLRTQAAKALLRIAATFQANEKASWLSGPPRSKPGEHLRGDTWNARDNLVYTPTDIASVARTLEVAVGYRKNAWYAPAWELRGDDERRIGLLEKLQEFRRSGLPADVMSSYVS